MGLGSIITGGIKDAASFIWDAIARMPEDFWQALKHPIRSLLDDSLVRGLGIDSAPEPSTGASQEAPPGARIKPPLPDGEDAFEGWIAKSLEWRAWAQDQMETVEEFMPQAAKQFIGREWRKSTVLGLLATIASAIAVVGANIQGIVTGYGSLVGRTWLWEFMPQLPDIATLVTLGIRHPDMEPNIKQMARLQGWHPALYDLVEETYEAIPDDATLRDWYFRILPKEELPEDRVDEVVRGELRKRGYRDEAVDLSLIHI